MEVCDVLVESELCQLRNVEEVWQDVAQQLSLVRWQAVDVGLDGRDDGGLLGVCDQLRAVLRGRDLSVIMKSLLLSIPRVTHTWCWSPR